ncbi:LysM peptidoglycan-binding domain-containing protein [candidate division WWE3 bacterium]|nr:LysM peptidoglycan-binding domain-containing protein [candidate division WWE3 bacterium]
MNPIKLFKKYWWVLALIAVFFLLKQDVALVPEDMALTAMPPTPTATSPATPMGKPEETSEPVQDEDMTPAPTATPTSSAIAPPSETEEPSEPESEPTQTPTPSSSGEEAIHIVQSGEGFYAVARQYPRGSLSLAEFARAIATENGLSFSSSLYVGQELRIPPPQ